MKMNLNIKTLLIPIVLFFAVSANIINTAEEQLPKIIAEGEKLLKITPLIQNIYQENDDSNGTKRKKADKVTASSVQQLIAKENANPTELDHYSRTPLMWAAWFNAPDTLTKLLKHKRVRRSINQQDEHGNTALSHALKSAQGTCGAGYDRIVRRLLRSKADPNLGNKKRTPLEYAAKTGVSHLVLPLLKADAEITDKAIREAASSEMATLLKMLNANVDLKIAISIVEHYHIYPTHPRAGNGPIQKDPYEAFWQD